MTLVVLFKCLESSYMFVHMHRLSMPGCLYTCLRTVAFAVLFKCLESSMHMRLYMSLYVLKDCDTCCFVQGLKVVGGP